MKTPLSLALALLFSSAAFGAEKEDGFVPMFNGRDLTGWVNANCAPETWSVRDGMIFCTGHPTGVLRTTRQYENFILEVEWRHLSSGGNSGVFVWGSPINPVGVHFLRGIEVQVLDHGYAEQFEKRTGKKSTSFTVHGDVFPIQGATMKALGKTNGRRSFPTEDRSKPSPEWNHYRIEANNGSIRLHVNGKHVSGGDDCNYRKGYLALESEGGPIEFRNLRIKELPSTNAAPELTAAIDPGWRSLFNGLDLRGWRANDATAARWEVTAEDLVLKTGAAAEPATLWTSGEFGAAEFIVDFQPAKAGTSASATVRGTTVELAGAAPNKYSRFTITVQGKNVRVTRDEGAPVETPLAANAPARGAFGLRAVEGAGKFMNLLARDL
ncbi:MAG TPA: family 16 glycoside hydrolase [Opitutaceae bacterium]|nr:family 16 glycoside hydrolase [Opitutaceae bacterium]